MKRRILVVEDDAHLADGLRINLELEGYDPVLAPSAEQALEIWRRGGIELVLLDVMLPGMDGFQFCRLVREEGDRVPILFLTARTAGEDRIKGLDQGGESGRIGGGNPTGLKGSAGGEHRLFAAD